MWLDGIVAVLFIGSAALGLRKGLFSTALHTFGWLAALILGFVWSPSVDLLLREKTDLFERLLDAIVLKCMENGQATTAPLSDGFPKVLGDFAAETMEPLLLDRANALADLLFQIFTLVGTILFAGLLFSLLARLLIKRKRGGILNFGNGFAGFLFGCVRGILLVFLFLALLVPAEAFLPNGTIQTALQTSHFAADLYDNNFLLLLLSGIFL